MILAPILSILSGAVRRVAQFLYFRPGGTDRYLRPDGTSTYRHF